MILTLLSCHLFVDARVVCAADEPCAGDTGPVDSGGEDTGPSLAPSVGWVMSLAGDGEALVRRFNAKGQQVDAWEGLPLAGPVAVDPVTLDGVVVDGPTLVDLPAEGPVTSHTLPTLVAYDVDMGNGVAWVAAGEVVHGFAPRTAFELQLGEGAHERVTSVALDGYQLWAVDVGDGLPDLYRYDVQTFDLVDHQPDIDTTIARVRNLFIGPGGEPYGCSGAGAIYRLADLGEGVVEVVAWAQIGADDVSDCAWDPDVRAWLVASPSTGVFRVDPEGNLENVTSPPSGLRLVRANFYR